MDDYLGRSNKKGSKRAVRLDEIGPRMELRLVKIADGVPGKEGAILYHKFGTWTLLLSTSFACSADGLTKLSLTVKKSKAEAASQKKAHAEKEKLRKERREEQERNVARKKALAEEKGAKKARFEDEEDEDEDVDEGEEMDEDEDDDDDDGTWDEEEEISEGEDSGVDEDSDEESEDDKEVPKRPTKRSKPSRKER